MRETVQLIQHREEYHSLVLLSLYTRLESEMGVVSIVMSEDGCGFKDIERGGCGLNYK